MTKEGNKNADRYVPMNFSLTIEHINTFTEFCKKYNVKYSKMIRLFIEYFNEHKTESEELIERYF